MLSEQEQIEIFSTCLRAVEQGKASVDQCVRRYPDVAGLREMLETAQTARRLPAISMSDARKAQMREQFASKISASKAAGRSARQWLPLPLTYAATLLFMFVVGAVLVRAVLQKPPEQSPGGFAVSTITAPASSTPNPQSTDVPTSTTPAPQPTAADEFAVSMTLTGVVQAVTMQSQGAFTASLDDGSLIIVNPNTDGAQNVVVGQAISVLAAIDDENNLIATTISIADNTSGSATAEATLAATPANCGQSGSSSIAASLAKSFNVAESEITGWFCKGYGYGEIARAYLLAQKGGKLTPDQIFGLRAGGAGWGPIIKASGVSPKDLAPGAEISAGKGRGNGNGKGNGKGNSNSNTKP